MNTQSRLRKGEMMFRIIMLILLLLLVGCGSSKPARPYVIAEETNTGTSHSGQRPYLVAEPVTTGPQYTNVDYGFTGANVQSGSGRVARPIAARPEKLDMTEKGYRVGPGDILDIKIFQLLQLNKEENLRSQIDRKGYIYLPLIEHIAVAGQTTTEIKENLVQILSSRYIKEPRVDVSMAQYGSKVVMMMGQVNRPGEVVLRSNATTLMDAITMAGGIKGAIAPEIEILRGAYKPLDNLDAPRSNLDKQILAQAGTQRELVIVAELFAETGRQINPVIYPGDIVHIRSDTEGFVYLMGEVRRPGSTPFRRPLNVLQAISCAGGMTDIAEPSKCKIIRRLADGSEKEIMVDLKKVRAGHEENVLLAQHDTILVPVNPTKKFFYGLGKFIRVGASATYDAAQDMGIPSAGHGGGSLY